MTENEDYENVLLNSNSIPEEYFFLLAQLHNAMHSMIFIIDKHIQPAYRNKKNTETFGADTLSDNNGICLVIESKIIENILVLKGSKVN